MKPLAIVFAALLVASVASAQRSGGGHSGGGHSGGGGFSHGGGGFSHGGGGFSHGGGGFTHGGGGFSYGGGGFSHGGGGGWHGGYRGSAYGRGFFGSSYAVPFFGFGWAPIGMTTTGSIDPAYSMGYSYVPPPAAEPMEQYADQYSNAQPLPPPDEETLKIYTAPAPSPQQAAMQEGRYYLIAYKDHSVYTALAYWMENGALNYVTPQNAHNQVSLDLLDLDLTKQLNARRGYAFNIVTH